MGKVRYSKIQRGTRKTDGMAQTTQGGGEKKRENSERKNRLPLARNRGLAVVKLGQKKKGS